MSATFNTHPMPSSPSSKQSWRSSRRMVSSRFISWTHRRRSSRSRSHSRSPPRWNKNSSQIGRPQNGINNDFGASNSYHNLRKSSLNCLSANDRLPLPADGEPNITPGALPPQSELFAQDFHQRQRPLNPDRFNRVRRFSRPFRRRSRSPSNRVRVRDSNRSSRLQSPRCSVSNDRSPQSRWASSVTESVAQPKDDSQLPKASVSAAVPYLRDSEICFALVRDLPANLDWDDVLQIFSRFRAVEVCYASEGWRITFPSTQNRDAAVKEMNGYEWRSHQISIRPWSPLFHQAKFDQKGLDGVSIAENRDDCIGFVFEALLQTCVEQAWRDVIEAPVFSHLEEWAGKPRSSSDEFVPTFQLSESINLCKLNGCERPRHRLESITNVESFGAQADFGDGTSTHCIVGNSAAEFTFCADIAPVPVSSLHENLKPTASGPYLNSNQGPATESASLKGAILAFESSDSSFRNRFDATNSTNIPDFPNKAASIRIFPSLKVERSRNKRGRPPGSKTNHSVPVSSENEVPFELHNPLCSFCGANDDQDQMVKCGNLHSCRSALHIYCMAPPLRRVPRQWACHHHHITTDSSTVAANLDEDDDEEDDHHEVREWHPSRRQREQREALNVVNLPSNNVVTVKPAPVHQFGCARAAGISLHLMLKNSTAVLTRAHVQNADCFSNTRRSNRAHRRRLSSVISCTTLSAPQLNSLNSRVKNLQLFRSSIHAWGVRSCEPLNDGDLVIEYIGEYVSVLVADIREKRYERIGIGSSYFFKVDDDLIIDATKKGNLARYINHSCAPNCRAKIVTVGSKRRIVIYAKQFIPAGDELCYDYKFPNEPEQKIPCFCGAKRCRGYLN